MKLKLKIWIALTKTKAICEYYCEKKDCIWTETYHCPSEHIEPAAADDGTLGFRCCCTYHSACSMKKEGISRPAGIERAHDWPEHQGERGAHNQRQTVRRFY
eukprot:UN22492